jgi:predicted AlkP superfamily pyrophosphatase or phosphodiesterase
MNESDWDFTMIVFRGTDTAQHFLFDKKDLLLSCYQKVDEFIGKIMNRTPDALFFVVSDHGFEEIKKILYPDNVLYNSSFLTPSQDPYDSPVSQFYSLIYRAINWFLGILPAKFLRESKTIKKLLFSGSSKAKLIDFSKTKAFSF